MEYHVCKFSYTVVKSVQVPAPHGDAKGYVRKVLEAVRTWRIDLIIPIHEEIFFLAECGERDILDRLFAPPFDLLVRLHHKWEFTKLTKRLRLGVPEASLCRNYEDVRNLPVDKHEHGMALKPCFGRASTGVHHLKPGEALPEEKELDIGDHNHYIAQEWLKGPRYCSYSVVREGKVEATGLYPVVETIDGSSSVYFKQQFHARIYAYIDNFVRHASQLHGPFSGQLAFDFVDYTPRNQLVAIECNPRSTSGLHLWSSTPYLAYILTHTLPSPSSAVGKPEEPPRTPIARRPAHVQVSAGMMMWEHKDATLGVWVKHMGRLMGTRDVVFRWTDLMPTIAQAFLLTTYYKMCRSEGLQLPELFQHQVLWEPKGEHLEEVRRIMAQADEREVWKVNAVDGDDEKDGLMDKARHDSVEGWDGQAAIA